MTKRYVFTLLLLITIVPCLNAQKKEIAQARTIIKSGKNLEKAEQQMRTLLKDSANSRNVKAWLALTDAVRGQYLAANEKLYLRQKQDTAALFRLTLKMFRDYESLDSIDMLPDEKGRVRGRYREHNALFLDAYRPNLFHGGSFFLRRRDYGEAFTFFDAFLDCQRQPLFGHQHYEKDALNPKAAFWTLFCGHQLDKSAMALKYRELALQDTARLTKVLELLAEVYQRQDDVENYEKTLVDGFRHDPSSAWFFPRLVDFYNAKGQSQQAMKIVDEALAKDSMSHVFLYAKSSLLLNGGDYDSCITICDSLIARGDTLSGVWYNAGVAYLNKAFVVEKGKPTPKLRKEALGYYRKALPYIERFRILAPEEKDKWAAALYNIYLNLNMGREFEEIDRLLRL